MQGMKKIITILAILLVAFTLPSFVLAQGKQQGQGAQQLIGVGNKGIEKAVQNLKRVTGRNNNPEIGEQIRSMVQSHEEIQTRTKTALHQMSQRNQVLKFMIGPDYKNAGEIRSDVVGIRNDIRKLERIKENSLPIDVGDVQGAIDELQVEASNLETSYPNSSPDLVFSVG